MNPDFSHLQELVVKKENTAEYELFEIDTNPVLIVRCIADNDDYQSKIRAKREQITRELRAKRKKKLARTRINDQIFDLLRGPDREAYPGAVVIGWNSNKDAKGKEVSYSDEACADFLRALPDWLFDGIRLFCLDAQNFITQSMSEEEEDSLAEN